MLDNRDVEYVYESLEVKDPTLDEFSNVFARFKPPPESASVRLLMHCAAQADCLLDRRRGRAFERRGHLLRR